MPKLDMIDIFIAAKYVAQRYRSTFGQCLDEMKLHKLLYFAQRESFVMFDQPMFTSQFEAWKYGPVMRCLRGRLWDTDEDILEAHPEILYYVPAFDKVFDLYAGKSSWTLSSVSHGESCWQKAKDRERGSHPVEIMTEDIRQDAATIKLRRLLYS